MEGLTEFDLIKRYFAPLSRHQDQSIQVGSGDDCAVISCSEDSKLCFSIDTMVEGVHFPKDAPPFLLGYRALAAALSDLAAMGAVPYFFTLALTIPKIDAAWLERFSAGLGVLVDRFKFPLIGGDTTRGPLTISIQVHGILNALPLLRSGAKPGDVLAVSGTLGDAGAALELLPNPGALPIIKSESEQFLFNRYYQPEPRIKLGRLLSEYANSCIDISDGLLAEATHISERSQVRLSIDSTLIPLSRALLEFKGLAKARSLALSSGDDYELLFTISREQWAVLKAHPLGGQLTKIGVVESGNGVFLDGEAIGFDKKGYMHFE